MNELQAFRNEISNYKFYKNKIVKLNEEIEDKFYELFGVHGLDPSKMFIENKDYNQIERQKLKSLEKFDQFKKEKEKEINRLKSQISHIDNKLKKMNPKASEAFICIYINNMSYKETCLYLNIIDSDGNPKLGELQYLMKKSF